MNAKTIGFSTVVAVVIIGVSIAGSALAQTVVQSTSVVASSPVAQISCAPGLQKGLARGSRGAAVVALQKQLAAFGYFSASATGYFGPITYGAVISYQKSNGLPATGYFGPMTYVSITARCTPITPPPPSSTTTSFSTIEVGATPGSPSISAITPTSGNSGASVTLHGSGFAANMIVRFAEGSVSHTTTSDGTSITFSIPDGIGPYCGPGMMCAMYLRQLTPGDYQVFVQNADGSVRSNSVVFTVTGDADRAY